VSLVCRACCCSGNYGGEEGPRLTALKTAAALGAAYIDVELLAAEAFFEDGFSMPPGVQLILSNHDFEATPSLEELRGKIDAMWAVRGLAVS
jgi:3-dehydroquinate dehydratase/shikimate dehydrogenase